MKKLILVRTGSTAWQESSPNSDADNKPCEQQQWLQGTVPLPLTVSGKRALEDIAVTLQREGAEVLYSSGNESSGPAAQFLAGLCPVKVKKLPLLRELDCGLWQGLRIKEIQQRFGRAYKQWRSDPTSICPPQGESVESAAQRVQEAMGKLQKKSKDKIIVIVAAPIISALLECYLNQCVQDQLWHFADQTEQVRIYETDENGAFSRCQLPVEALPSE